MNFNKAEQNAKQSILQYLTNIKFNEGVIQGYKNKKINPIYEVTADRKTIFNLDTNTKQYLAFLQFMNIEFAKIYDEFQNNDGHIITSHLFDNTDKDNEKILEQYKQKYVTNFTKVDPEAIKTDNYKNIKGHYYPHFESDMMAKTRELQYQEIEKIIGIDTDKKGIQEHTSLEFLDIIIKRIEGLYKCLNSDDKKMENKEYYRKELYRELKELEKLLGILNNENNDWISVNEQISNIIDKIEDIKSNKNEKKADEIVKEHCKTILWGVNDSKYNEELKNNKFKKEKLEEFKAFIEDKKNNHNELIFLKTFMIDCFKQNDNGNYTNEIDWDKVFEKMGDRKYRQMIFGFTRDTKIYDNYKSFFEVLISNEIYIETYNKTCDYLIIWSMFMNFYFNKCSITNTDIDIPIRFKLPIDKKNRKDKNSLIYNNIYSQFSYDFRSIPRNSDIFDTNSYTLFIGFINIKFYYEKVKEFRNWTLFVFKTEDKEGIEGKKFFNYMTGQLVRYPIFSHELEMINDGSIVARDPATYEEIKFFKKESEKEKDNIFIYISKLDNQTLFITPKQNILELDYLQDLQLERVSIITVGENITTSRKDRHIQIIPYSIMHSGGNSGRNNNLNLSLKLSKNLNIYNYNLTDSNIYNNYLKLNYRIDNIEVLEGENIIYNFNKTLYKYLLISPTELGYFYLNNTIKNNKILLKYKPISSKFFNYNEIFINYNLFDQINKNTKILCIGSITPIELIKYKNYKCNNIKFINLYKLLDTQNQLINTIKSIYDININENFTYKDIYLLPNLYPELYGTFNLNIYSINKVDKSFYMLDIFYNVINIFIGALIGLKYTALNGTFILNLNYVSNKSYADIYLILKQHFKESYLYYPDISNMVKLSGVFGIFKGFKGILQSELEKLESIFEKLKKQYPNNMIENFNIYETDIRKQFNITKPIESVDKRYIYIDGFLNIPKNSKEFDNTYREIIDFNNINYSNRLSYVNKLLNLYENNKNNNNLNVKVPTQDQILSSILYCRKYDIPIFDKYIIKSQDITISKNILNELYGLHQPIFFEFKTPFKTHIADKIIFNPKFKSLSRNKSIYNSNKRITIRNFKTNMKTKHTKNNKHTKYSTVNNSFFKNLFSNDKSSLIKYKNKSKITKNKTTKNKTTKNKTTKNKNTKNKTTKNKSKTLYLSPFLKNKIISLENAIYYSNNSLIQVGRLIDVRKDFTKTNPTELYDKLKDQLRFYKGWSKAKKGEENRNVQNLDKKVQSLIGDFSISQAWVKMYEIITECKLIPTNRKGIFKSFHICEAPGTFINCINNYIHTKTNYNDFEWKAQSLKPSGNIIGDDFGLIKRHRNNWDWGVDGTGDITNIENIKYYAKIAKDMNINLMTSDCGLKMGDPKYYQVAYASYVSILYSLPINGTFLYKILTPIDVPLIWNLIYITYTNFKEMYFFKPVQNSQSREFYIIAKGYLGIDQKTLDKLLNIVEKFESGVSFDKNEYDLYNDTYPEEFVIQVQTISERLANNYVNSIERIIYYVDNIDLLGKDYQKHIENYIKEKNEDWVRKYKPMRLDRKFVL